MVALESSSVSPDALIAVVEDDPALLKSILDLVESLGYRASGHSSAEAYLGSGDLAADCVITDIQMPGLTGIDLARRLVDLGLETPVIMVTARKDAALLQRAWDAKPACLLQKPFSAEALIDCLQSALAAR